MDAGSAPETTSSADVLHNWLNCFIGVAWVSDGVVAFLMYQACGIDPFLKVVCLSLSPPNICGK